MNMEFVNCDISDVETIFGLYDVAIAHQKMVSDQHWLPFDRELVVQEIEEKRQWKILIDGEIACVFVTAYSDPHIWGERDSDPSVYIHRIVTNPNFRGKGFVQLIVEWAKIHAKALGKKFLRLDTWVDNLRLQGIYIDSGFTFLGVGMPANPSALPRHYSTISLGFYEIRLN